MEVDKLLLNAVWLSLGVVPLNATNIHFDVNRALAALPTEEARTMRRKFRKLWRKLAACKIAEAKSSRVKGGIVGGFGLGQEKQTRAQRNARKRQVYAAVKEQVVDPMLHRGPKGGAT